jgi:hypothetical protein
MSAVKKVVNIMRISTVPLPLPNPIELVLKPYIEELIQIPPPYCPVCNSFLTNPFCNKMVQPRSCPLNSE